MNLGLKIILIHWIMIGCASTPKPVVKKKAGAAMPAKNTKGKVLKKVPAKAVPPPPVNEAPANEEEEEEDDQFSRIKKYYKK
jgi:hypothetical protein